MVGKCYDTCLRKRLGIKKDRRPDDGKVGANFNLVRFFTEEAKGGYISLTKMAKGCASAGPSAEKDVVRIGRKTCIEEDKGKKTWSLHCWLVSL